MKSVFHVVVLGFVMVLVLGGCQSTPEVEVDIAEEPITNTTTDNNNGVPYVKGPTSPPGVKGPTSLPSEMTSDSDTPQSITEVEKVEYSLPKEGDPEFKS